VHKITIIPRGIAALGYTEQCPTEDRYLMTQTELVGRLDVMLGGRVAEKTVFGEVRTGAANDLQRATELARAMISEYGMGTTLEPVTYSRRSQPVFLLTEGGMAPAAQEFSEETASALDRELQELLNSREQTVLNLLECQHELLEKVAEVLLKKEVLDGPEFMALVEEAGASKAECT
jgi:cell division protease FtsH